MLFSFLITDDYTLDPIVKDIFMRSVPFAIRNPILPTGDAIILVDDKEFPFTTNEPIAEQDGLLCKSQCSVIDEHIIFNIILIDEDRTKNQTQKQFN